MSPDFGADFNRDAGGFLLGNSNGPQPIIRQNYGVPVLSPVATLAIVGTQSTDVIEPNFTRRGIIFANPGPAMIYVVPMNVVAATLGIGIKVDPAADPVEFIGDPDKLIFWTCGWRAAASAPNAPLTILEVFG